MQILNDGFSRMSGPTMYRRERRIWADGWHKGPLEGGRVDRRAMDKPPREREIDRQVSVDRQAAWCITPFVGVTRKLEEARGNILVALEVMRQVPIRIAGAPSCANEKSKPDV